MWGEGGSESKETGDSGGRDAIFQILEDRVLQVEVSKYQRKKEKKKKRRDSTCDQAIKGTAREEAGVFYVRKGTGIL